MPNAPKRYKPPGKKRQRRSAAGRERHKLYDKAAWRRATAGFLAHNPWCRECEQNGVLRAATATDHVIPHKGDEALFWDRSNWAALCGRCHGKKSATE